MCLNRARHVDIFWLANQWINSKINHVSAWGVGQMQCRAGPFNRVKSWLACGAETYFSWNLQSIWSKSTELPHVEASSYKVLESLSICCLSPKIQLPVGQMCNLQKWQKVQHQGRSHCSWPQVWAAPICLMQSKLSAWNPAGSVGQSR